MTEIKFACPSCAQHIACDTGYCGMEISCPVCKAKMIVPQVPGVPSPPPATGTPPPPLPPPTSAADQKCPGCGAGVTPDAMICTQCGTNLQTGRRHQQDQPTRSKPGAKRSKPRKSPGGESPWYKTPHPYLLLLLGGFGALYYFGREDETMAMVFLGSRLFYGLCIHIATVVCAWRDEGTLWGVLCLLIPLVGIYYVFFRSENPTLQAFYGVNILLTLTSWLL